MSDIMANLDKVRDLLKDTDFLESKGLSNEVNIRIFRYEPKDEMAVRHFVSQVLTDQTLPCHLIEKNLYEVFLAACEERRILNRIDDMEKKKGKAALHAQIQKAVTVQSYVNQICAEPFQTGDVLILTGIGDAFPFMRVHMVLEALQPKVNIPILVMYPGTFNGREVSLFGLLKPNPYYRAFSVI